MAEGFGEFALSVKRLVKGQSVGELLLLLGGLIDDYDEEDAADIAPLIRKYLHPGDDENIRRALEVVLLDRKASTSYLQRRLKIGYNRAAEIIDLFEERGIVGPPSGSGNKREILVFDEAEFAG